MHASASASPRSAACLRIVAMTAATQHRCRAPRSSSARSGPGQGRRGVVPAGTPRRAAHRAGRGLAAGPVQGVFAAQEIKPQARVLATDRGIGYVTLDYELMHGADDASLRLF